MNLESEVKVLTRLRLALALALLLPASFAVAQRTPSETTLIKTARGVLVVHNEPGLNFTLELSGKELQPLESGDSVFVKLDGRVSQVHTVPVTTFAPDLKDRKLNDWLVLERHRDWESDYIGQTLGVKLRVSSEVLTLKSNRAALYWSYPMPAGVSSPAKNQLYLTVLSGGSVVMLNCSVEGNDTEALAKKFMMEALTTLKVSDKPIDVKAIQEAIRRGVM